MKKFTIKEMHILAKYANIKCISVIYKGMNTKLEWECACGHKWWATPNNIKKGTRCPKCSHKYKPTIEDIHILAKLKGIKLISTAYKNCYTKLQWECFAGPGGGPLLVVLNKEHDVPNAIS